MQPPCCHDMKRKEKETDRGTTTHLCQTRTHLQVASRVEMFTKSEKAAQLMPNKYPFLSHPRLTATELIHHGALRSRV